MIRYLNICLCLRLVFDLSYRGISPAQAELSYLDKVKWLDMYGVDLHPVLVIYVLKLIL